MDNKQVMQPCTEDYETTFGTIYKVPKRSCVLCKHCESILLDSGGLYMFVCYKAVDEDGVMDVFEIGGPYGNCDKYEPKRGGNE